MIDSQAALEDRLLRTVEAQRADGLALLDELLRASKEDEAAMQAIVAGALRDAGFELDVFEADLAALHAHPEFSLLPELASLGTAGRPNVVARMPGAGSGKSLFVFAHVDSYSL